MCIACKDEDIRKMKGNMYGVSEVDGVSNDILSIVRNFGKVKRSTQKISKFSVKVLI